MPIRLLIACLSMTLASMAAHAERADSKQPVNIEADRVSVDDRNKTHTFEGNVILSQGTLSIRGNRLVVTQNEDGFQKGVAIGGADGRASFRQRREGRNEFVEGLAEKIEYDGRTEKATLVGRAEVRSGGDLVKGQYIEYDGMTENYLVTNGRAPGTSSSESSPRVKAVIQPKGISPAPATTQQSPGSN
ncbi:MAG: lipopolysaccharide transport periplasmic protein LptA [Rhodocyclaceae bacterium]